MASVVGPAVRRQKGGHLFPTIDNVRSSCVDVLILDPLDDETERAYIARRRVVIHSLAPSVSNSPNQLRDSDHRCTLTLTILCRRRPKTPGGGMEMNQINLNYTLTGHG